ncbi:MAG TPA: Hint domain-containing protein [Alphaproteobacteria bacterium]|jgi:hypothetical protein|nr:Hint domain-containing protein [Alphaproteobacteria bacterium]
MSTDTITSDVTTGVTLASGGTYGNPVTVASGVEISGSYALVVQTPWTVENEGTIAGATRGIFVSTGASGYVAAWITNDVGGTITAGGNGIAVGDSTNIGPITLDNEGYISAYRAVVLLSGGAITNEASGTIEAGKAGITGQLAPVTIDNAGTIAGDFNGIYLGHYYGSGASQVVNEAGGTISGPHDGIYITQSYATVTNHGAIDSQLADGVNLRGVAATLENSGTIAGGRYSAYLNASGSNRLIVDAGAVFDGEVVARAGAANTIELTSGASAGTLTGLGSEYVGFQTVTIDTGAIWDIAGTMAAFDGTTIDGFGSHDRLDLTDLAFNAGDTATLNGSNRLVIADPGGNVTIQLDGNVTGDLFKLVSDGHGGTFTEESDYTPCFCRGTRIRTPGGDRPIEDLRIGDLIMTAEGQSLPLKWVGRRSYHDWLAVGNAGVQPIRFRAGSIADRVPARDLYVSPEHAMFIDGMLIPAEHLVNGVSILKVEGMESVDYFHLEFDRHVVIFAEGAKAESFVDDDSRILFHNADEYRRLYSEEPKRQYPEFCAPRVEDWSDLEMLRRRLAERARRLRPNHVVARAAPRRGYVDRATRAVVEGWAHGDAASGEQPARLAILVNGAVIGDTLADRRRADLKASGLGDCGFRFVLPLPLSPELAHRIEVRRESDWSLLHGGPVLLAAAP